MDDRNEETDTERQRRTEKGEGAGSWGGGGGGGEYMKSSLCQFLLGKHLHLKRNARAVS